MIASPKVNPLFRYAGRSGFFDLAHRMKDPETGKLTMSFGGEFPGKTFKQTQNLRSAVKYPGRPEDVTL